ncbi:MAG: type II secretion system F family protein [Bacteriovoracaceae bacterium]
MLRGMLPILTIVISHFALAQVTEENRSRYEQIEFLKSACDRKEYANCYQLALKYLEDESAQGILLREAEDKEFLKLEIAADKLEQVKKTYRNEGFRKIKNDQGEIVNSDQKIYRLKDSALEFFGNRLLYLSCVNAEKYSCLRISDDCANDNSEACKNRENAMKKSDRASEMILEHESQRDSTLIYWGAILFLGIAAFLIARNIFQDEDEFQTTEKLEESAGKKDEIAKHGIVLKYSRPFFKRYVSPIVQGMKGKKKIREKYKRKLASAGLTSVLTPEDFYSFKIFLILGFPLLYYFLKVFMEMDWPIEYIPAAAIVGFYYPDLWIQGKIAQRQKEVMAAMPFCVDMLALSVEAGLDFVAAMTKVIEKARKTALSEEFEIMIKEIRIGASRAEALRNMAWRIDMIQVSSFSATLIASDSVGAPIGPILKSLSQEIRNKRSSDVEKAGATAATKILIPMIFFIVPSVLAVIMGPVVVDYITNQ